MALQPTHDLHKRRMGRNIGTALVLVAFIGIVFGLTLVKTNREGAARQAPATEASQ
ncbi:hypothetical protein [Mesobacterium pallidum]|uniref:hypothetical protein n=1 Tax=Mesobacterium pallidum TaxID=2872037 RepID=UPI001EE1E2F0|nr:hypothetical protein [Mesobacterium pallidum]